MDTNLIIQQEVMNDGQSVFLHYEPILGLYLAFGFSAYYADMFLIETSGLTILVSGDFRSAGPAPAVGGGRQRRAKEAIPMRLLRLLPDDIRRRKRIRRFRGHFRAKTAHATRLGGRFDAETL